MENLQLFEAPGTDERPEFALRLGRRLGELSARGVHLGASSWKYEGWLGQVYSRGRYETRGRFSRKKFEETCLAEYALTFPAVGGDFSFYQFPSDDFWRRLFTGLSRPLLFGFKSPEMVTVRQWPAHARYGGRAGQPNEMFLNAELFENAFARPLSAYREHVGVMMFEFGTFNKSQYENVEAFARDLDAFLARLNPQFRYAVEIRNREFLDAPYFDTLRRHHVAHVFNAWTRMPELKIQTAIPEAYSADFTVSRALLRAGRTYEQAVKTFEPYTHVQDPDPAARDALRELIDRALKKHQTTFVFVNNRLEGNAPATLAAVADA